MITIAFHSYKGGTGRTLAAAQLAVLLTRFNRKVVAVDFDVESPGLASRLEPSFKTFETDQGWLRHAKIFEQTSKLVDLAQFVIIAHPKCHLLVPGSPFGSSSGYWNSLAEMGHFEGEQVVPYFERLKVEISRKLKPDYLLIDAPSGFSSLAGVCTNLLADVVVSLTTGEKDSLQGTNHAAISTEERRYSGHRVPKRTVYALTRFPDRYESDHGMTQLEAPELSEILNIAKGTISSGLRQPKDVQTLFLVRSEPRLQLGSVIPIPFRGTAMASAVVHDYCDLFGDVVPELAEDLGTLRGGVKITRTYYLVADAGQMINPADNAPNVAFRVDTLQSLVDSLVTSIAEASSLTQAPKDGAKRKTSKRKRELPTVAASALFDSGYVAAKKFSEYLTTRWLVNSLRPVTSHSTRAWLKEWCVFDSTVGFGRFDAEFSSEFAGEVVVYNSFLIAGRGVGDWNLCGFMIGYISRILEVVFAGKAVTVTHKLETDCGQFTKHEPPECRFRFVAEPVPRAGAGGPQPGSARPRSSRSPRIRTATKTA